MLEHETSRRGAGLASLTLAALLLGGCGTVSNYMMGRDNNEPPAELQPIDNPVQIQTLWSRDVGAGAGRGAVGLAPVLHDGRLYAADAEGEVMALAAATGERLWTVDVDLPLSGGPGTDGELLALGSEDGHVVALAAADGAERWRVRVSSEVLAPPRMADDYVLVRTVDGKLTALAAADGARRWVYDRTVPVLSLRGTSAPVVYRGLVIGGFDSGRLAALDLRDGQVVWETRIAEPRGRSELERLVDIDAEPLLRDGLVYVVSFQGRVAAIDARNGEVVWQRDMSSHAGVGADQDQLYVSDDQSHVWALDRASSASLWRQQQLEYRRLNAPTPLGDYVVVGDLEGHVHWLRRTDGAFAARVRVGSGPIYAPALSDGERIYIYNSDGALAALRPAG